MFKILLVDDEYMILEGLKQIIDWQALGFEIVGTARSGPEALAFLAKQPVDLVISDITMPEMTGLAMIAEAQEKGYRFATVFLTGYQEFEYVKEGLRLGIKGYLVKPVDQDELVEVVKSIAQELKEAKIQAEQRQLYLENTLGRWLNDELNEQEFAELMKDEGLSEDGPYTAIKIMTRSELIPELVTKIHSLSQKLIVPLSVQQLILIFKGSTAELNVFLAELRRYYTAELKIYVGETVSEWENLYESNEKIRQLEALNNFYPELLPGKQGSVEDLQEGSEFSLLAFNKALMIGDLKTIEAELANIFQTVVRRQIQPENARYLAFMIFTDISRQYPSTSGDLYDEIINKIRHSKTIVELQDLLDEVLLQMSKQPVQVQFSEVTQKVVDLVARDYRQDLTLKSVADELHLNPVYLGQLFKKEIHNSFSQYLNQVRIKKAQQLLLYSNLNINEIADEIGYNNNNYFSKMFKKLNGLTPKDFRDQYHGDYAGVGPKE